jgi:hypothetical protein
MIHNSLKVPSLLAALLLSGSAIAGEPRETPANTRAACADVKSELFETAKAQGAALDTERFTTLAIPEASVAAAPILDLAKVPDAEFAKGVDVAFLYLDNPETKIPAGHYRVQVSAKPEDIKAGRFQGVATLLDKDGKPVAELPAAIESKGSSARYGTFGGRTNLGINQDVTHYNLDRFRSRVYVILYSGGRVVVLDLFHTDYSDYYGW